MINPVTPPHWCLYTPFQRATYLMFVLTGSAALVWSLRTIEIIPEFLYDAPEQAADLFIRMWPFDWAFYPKAVHSALIETFHIATLGTLLGLALALPLAFLSARNITRSPVFNWIAQVLFVSSRSINSLIWALLFVAIFGPGALAGVMSIAFRSIGFVLDNALSNIYWDQVGLIMAVIFVVVIIVEIITTQIRSRII